jgi:hypothetical protein
MLDVRYWMLDTRYWILGWFLSNSLVMENAVLTTHLGYFVPRRQSILQRRREILPVTTIQILFIWSGCLFEEK